MVLMSEVLVLVVGPTVVLTVRGYVTHIHHHSCAPSGRHGNTIGVVPALLYVSWCVVCICCTATASTGSSNT